MHFYTARMLIGHLHRYVSLLLPPSSGLTSISVHLQSGENKMTPANLGVVFGRESCPSQRDQNLTVFSATVLRSRDPSREFR